MVTIPSPQVDATVQQQIKQTQQSTTTPMYVPIDASEFMKELINNDHIPPDIVKKASFWTAFGRSTKFSFLDMDDIEYLMNNFNILLIRFKQDIPKMYITPSVLSTLKNIESEYYVNLCRARGNGVVNERILIATSATANFAERTPERPAATSQGLIERLSSALSRRG